MQNYLDSASKAGDQLITVIADAQGAVVQAVATVSERVGSLIPSLPSLPFTGALPAPAALVDHGFGFVQKLVDAQKSYALDLLKALEPVSGKIVPAAKPKARKAAAKTAAA